MPDQSPILSLPLIQPAQAQKHVTHNEALRLLDVMVQLSVADRVRVVPPGAPVAGDRHIVAAGASGAWAGQAGRIALYEAGVWAFIAPLAGWRAYIEAEAAVASFNGAAWLTVADGPLQVAQLGVSATPDATNRLSVQSPATLLNHAGAGHQVKINKALATDTASLLFQTGFSGRAEIGTTGSDALEVKVSPNGSTFYNAISVAGGSGVATLAQPVLLAGQAADPASPVNGMLWHDSTTGRLKARLGGVTQIIDTGLEAPMLVPVVGDYVLTTTGAGGGATLTQAGAAGRLEIFPYAARSDMTVDRLTINCTTLIAAALAKLVVYDADATGRPAALLAETGDLDLATVGVKAAVASLVLRRGRTYWLGVRHSSTATLSHWAGTATPDINGGTAPVVTSRKVLRRSLAYGTAAPASWGFVASEITAALAPAIWLRMG